MADPNEETLIFNRYSREECGLPPRGKEGWRSRVTILRMAAVFGLTAAFAWLGGEAMARWRAGWVAGLRARVSVAEVEEIPGLLEQGRMFAAALPDNQRMRRDLALSVVTAAERMPRRLGYYGTAAGLFRGMEVSKIGGGVEGVLSELAAAGTFGEVGEFPEAFAALERADKMLGGVPEAEGRSLRLLLMNAQAYFLAVAGDGLGGDVVRAAELAGLAVSSRDLLPGGGFASGSAAFLDTLAVARGGIGDIEGAVSAQRMALGLAGSEGLEEYVRHYDALSSSVSAE